MVKLSNSRVWDKVLEGNTLVIEDTHISLQHGA